MDFGIDKRRGKEMFLTLLVFRKKNMKSLEQQVLDLFPEIAELAGTQMRRIAQKYDADCVEISGDNCVLKVRWEIEHQSVLIVTLYRKAKEAHLVPREINLDFFIRFKGGPDEEDKALSKYSVSDTIKLVKKYALSYLLGLENMDDVVNFARRVTEEETDYWQWRKANKWIRPEWPPSD